MCDLHAHIGESIRLGVNHLNDNVVGDAYRLPLLQTLRPL